MRDERAGRAKLSNVNSPQVVLMHRRVSYRIVEREDGRFDILVTTTGRETYSREGLKTRADVVAALTLLGELMEACGTILVEEPALGLAAE